MGGTCKIPLTKGAFALVDEEDFELVSQYKWHLNDMGYAVWRGIIDGKKKTIRMHRLIKNTPDELVTDHINHDRLDNRKSNLRICTQKENAKNRGSKGYCWTSEKQKYLVRHKNKFYCYTDTLEEAIKQSKLAKSGVPKVSRIHRRRNYLPTGVFYMQPMAQKGKPPYYIRPQINGKRYFKGYFRTVADAREAYELTMAATGGMTS